MANKHELVIADIMPIEGYGRQRRELRRKAVELKRRRRVEVGPFATFYFECYETMWHQVHEMLYIERGGPAQVPGELEAYNPLIPKGNELVATMMIEIDHPIRRQRELTRLGGIEHCASLSFAGEVVKGEREQDAERTTEDGKASSVQFMHFRFAPAQITRFRIPGTQVAVGLAHPNYGHMAIMPEATRAVLAEDFD